MDKNKIEGSSSWLMEQINIFRGESSQFLVVSGNIYDKIRFFHQHYSSLEEFFLELTNIKFPYFLRYTLSKGVEVLRGDVEELKKSLGIARKKTQEEEMVIAALGRSIVRDEFPKEPVESFSFFTKLLHESKQRSILFIEDMDILGKDFESTGVRDTRVVMANLRQWLKELANLNGHCIILCLRSAASLPNFLFDRDLGARSIIIPKPDENARKVHLISLGEKDEGLASVIAKASSGLSLKGLEKVYKQIPTAISGSRNGKNATELIFKVKREILESEYGNILEIMSPKWGFEAIGGLEKIVAKGKFIAEAMKSGENEFVPMGMLLCGPPGTGKTIFAEALAKESRMNFVRPKNLRSMWLGQSEERQLRFLYAIRDLAPVVVFIDEADQELGQRGGFDGDSGVNRRQFGEFLKIMSDETLRGKVLWCLVTNRPDLMDPAMKRPGRCDLRIPFLPPSSNEQVKIFQAMCRKYPAIKTDIENWKEFCLPGYTGADIDRVFLSAWETAWRRGSKKMEPQDVKWVLEEDYIPQRSDARKIAQYTLLAIAECSSKSLLPDNWEEVVVDAHEVLTGVRIKTIEKVLEDGLAKIPLSDEAN